MDWNQLEFFKITANTQNITKAAEILSISQPALSRAIVRLEEQLGFPLFDRRGKGIYLNRYGRLFLYYAEKALNDLSRGQQAVQDLLDSKQGTIYLGFIHSLGISLLPNLLKKFLAEFPEVEFKLYQSNASLLLDQLINGTSDFSICMRFSSYNDLTWEPLFTENLFAALPTGHRLANYSAISLKDLAKEPFISFKKDFGMRILTDQFFTEANCIPHIVFEGDDIITVAGLVEVGLGVSLLPRIDNMTGMNLVYIPIKETICSRVIGIAYVTNRYMPPVAKNFKNYILALYS